MYIFQLTCFFLENKEKNKKRKEICERLYFTLLDHYVITQLVESKTENDLELFSIYFSHEYGISIEISCLQFMSELICMQRDYYIGTKTTFICKNLDEFIKYILEKFPP